jgi:hypothetical protein
MARSYTPYGRTGGAVTRTSIMSAFLSDRPRDYNKLIRAERLASTRRRNRDAAAVNYAVFWYPPAVFFTRFDLDHCAKDTPESLPAILRT